VRQNERRAPMRTSRLIFTLLSMAVLGSAALADTAVVPSPDAAPSPGIGQDVITDSCADSLIPAPPPPPAWPRGADRIRPEHARRLIRGQTVDYGVWVDRAIWRTSWSSTPKGDLIFLRVSGGEGFAYTVALPWRIRRERAADLFIESIVKRGGRPTDIRKELRSINGK